jgi:transcriptional regulator with XRE-family HTH domain
VIGGELVREARKRAGLTQRELATRAGTTQSAIARLESGGTSPSLEQVERLLKLCGLQLIVELAPYDDSDIVQAEANLRRTPEERVARNASAVAFACERQQLREHRG